MFNLQLFTEAIQGKKIVYLYRVEENSATDAGELIAFVTDNENSASVDADTTQTKDGSIRTPGAPEIEITSTSILTRQDTMIDKLKNAMLNNKLVECWEANLDEPVDGAENQFKGTYYQGYITEVSISAGAEDFTEVSITYGANGVGAKGNVTVTVEQQETAAYVFTDTTAKS